MKNKTIKEYKIPISNYEDTNNITLTIFFLKVLNL